ncbi:MAG: YdcF family protein [Leptospiraceae bacterium]|nr:YdcF family protein [Leptospiraceae bacterium]
MALGILGTILLGVLYGSYGWVSNAVRYRIFDEVADVPPHTVGLVLGTSEYVKTGQRNLFFTYRMQAAEQLFRAGKIQYILVSGDNSTHRYNEPRAMREALLEAGIPSERIVMDFAGFRTLDSVVRARQVFGQTSLTVISQRFHNERAVLIGLHNGIDMYGFNARDVQSGEGLKTYIREWPARALVLADLFFLGTEPRFLGKKISIPPGNASATFRK